jgi:hypothetical protein
MDPFKDQACYRKPLQVGARGFEPPTPCAQGIADAAYKLLIYETFNFNELQNAY